MIHFGEFLKTWSLRLNSVTRQVSFNRTKIVGKCQKFKCDILGDFQTMWFLSSSMDFLSCTNTDVNHTFPLSINSKSFTFVIPELMLVHTERFFTLSNLISWCLWTSFLENESSFCRSSFAIKQWILQVNYEFCTLLHFTRLCTLKCLHSKGFAL